MPYIIKRYANRKLYDPQTSRYVTLDDLKQRIRGGTEVRVEDASSGEDLTALTLMHVLLGGERTRQAALPPTLLHQLIKYGEAWYELLHRTLQTSLSGQLAATPRDVDRVWREWARLAGWPSEPGPEPTSEATPPAPRPSLENEVAALKGQLHALQERLSKPSPRSVRKRARSHPTRSRR